LTCDSRPRLFAGYERGTDRAADKFNDINLMVWLADVLARIAEIPLTKLADSRSFGVLASTQ
jgi:hypothetical protein